MKTCKFCREQIQSEATKCRFCGEWQEEKESLEKKNSITIEYFSVSPVKLVAMSIVSLGLYDIYWFYKNWQTIFEQEKKAISFLSLPPIIRALPIFNIVFCYKLFFKIFESAKLNGYKTKFSALGLYLFYMVAFFFYGDDNLIFIIFYLRILPLLYVQLMINANNKKVNPNSKINNNFSFFEVGVALFGIILLVIIIYGKI